MCFPKIKNSNGTSLHLIVLHLSDVTMEFGMHDIYNYTKLLTFQNNLQWLSKEIFL